jgi:hypothetical protein
MDISKLVTVLAGNGVKEETLSPGYESFPERAMLRYGQERGLYLDMDRVIIPAVVRQATPVYMKKKVVAVPSKELPSKEVEKSRQDEPTSLVGVIQALNDRNAGVPVLAMGTKPTGGAQKRLRQRSEVWQEEPRERKSSESSVEFLGEVRKTPETERERGTTSASVVMRQVPVAASVDYDSSDNEAKDEIRLLQAQVDVLTAKLGRLKARYEVSRPRRK